MYLFLSFSYIVNFLATLNVFNYHKKNNSLNAGNSLYDIGHNMIIENHNFKYFSDIVDIYIVIFLLYLYNTKNKYILEKSVYTICTVFILRSISINLTYLPLPKTCTNRFPFLNGGCGDLMFSGHYTVFTVILYVCVLKLDLNIYIKSFISISFLLSIINTLQQRNHYSVDIYISIILTYLCAEKIM